MWPQLLILAASAFLKYQNEKQADNRRRSFQSAMEALQREKSKEGVAATEELLTKQTPKARGDELSQLTTDREQSLRQTVGAAQAFDAPGTTGKLSEDYRGGAAENANRIAERTRRAIEQLSAMGAPGEQRQKHQLRFGKAAGTVDASNRAIDSIGRGYMTDIGNVKPNPFVNLLADVGMGYATAGAGGAAAAGAGSAANNGQGFEDSSGNLYDSNTATNEQAAQDARIRRQMQQKRVFSIWGNG